MSVCSAFYFHFRFPNFLNILFLFLFSCIFSNFFLSFNFLLISHFIPISFFPFPFPILFLFMSVFFLSGPSLVLSGSGQGHVISVISVISDFFFPNLLLPHGSSSYDRIRQKDTTEVSHDFKLEDTTEVSVASWYGRIRQKPSVFFLTKNNIRDKQKGEINPLCLNHDAALLNLHCAS